MNRLFTCCFAVVALLAVLGDASRGQKPESGGKAADNSWDHLDTANAKSMDGFLRIEPNGVQKKRLIATKESFSGPIEVVVIARTAKKQISLSACKGANVIFNWESDMKTLAVRSPDPNGVAHYVPGIVSFGPI